MTVPPGWFVYIDNRALGLARVLFTAVILQEIYELQHDELIGYKN